MRYLWTMIRFAMLLVAAFVLLAMAACGQRGSPSTADDDPLLVFAAASLKESMDEAATAYAEAGGPRVQVSYAASSSLARQIEQGAPADVFISADLAWMDWLAERDLVDDASRRDLLGNDLVLVAPASGVAAQVDLAAGPDGVLERLGEGHVAMALVDAVPAGKYGREAFQSLGLWEELAPRVAACCYKLGVLMLGTQSTYSLCSSYGEPACAMRVKSRR